MEELNSSTPSTTTQPFLRESGESSSTPQPERDVMVEEIEHDGVVGMEPGTVIEEVVSTEQGYNEDGELVTYENVVVYDGSQQILSEEYVDLQDMQGGETEYAYVITDENGETRYLSASEVGNMVEHVEEVVHEVKPETKNITLPVAIAERRRPPANSTVKHIAKKPRAVKSTTRQSRMPAPQKSKFDDNLLDYNVIDVDDMRDLADLQEILPSYLREKFTQCLSRTEEYNSKPKLNTTLRDLIDKGLSGTTSSQDAMDDIVYMEDRPYFDVHEQIGNDVESDIIEENKGQVDDTARKSTLTHMLKVDVEKQNTASALKIKRSSRPMVLYHNVPGSGILEDDDIFQSSSKTPRQKKVVNPLTHNEVGETSTMSSVRGITTAKIPYIEKEDLNMRVKCPDCEEPFPTMERLCDHMVDVHEIHTHVRSTDFFSDRDVDSFLFKMERDCSNSAFPLVPHRRKATVGSAQLFKCNFMNKVRKTENPEMAEISLNFDGEEPEETCPAFALKMPAFESIRVKFCDYHVHYDPNMGFRVPISVKKRLFDMSYKRLPVPVMQAVLQHEAEKLCTPGSKIEERVKNLNTADIVDILSAMHNSIRKYEDEGITLSNCFQKKEETKEIDFAGPVDTDSPTQGAEEVEIEEISGERKIPPEEEPNEPTETKKRKVVEDTQPQSSQKSEMKEKEMPVCENESGDEGEEEDVIESVEGRRYYEESVDIGFDTQYLYDPESNRDAIVEDLNETEMHFLEGYEEDVGVHLTLEQKAERMRARIRFSINNICSKFLTLDSLTHGLIPNDMCISTIEELRKLSSILLDISCGLEAEIRGEFSHSSVQSIKTELIASVASRERNYNVITEKVGSKRKQNRLVLGPERPMERDRTAEIMHKVRAMVPPHRSMGINCSGTFELNKQSEGSVRGDHRGLYRDRPIIEQSQRPSSPTVRGWYPRQKRKQLNDFLQIPPKKRGRPRKSVQAQVFHPPTSDGEAGRSTLGSALMEHVNITTDDNVPHAIAMGVDQEVEVSTEEAVRADRNRHLEEGGQVVEERKITADERILGSVSESVKLLPPKKRDNRDSTEGFSDPTTVTRTGRVVKKKKWEND